MSVIGSNILAGASGQGGGYQISRSVRLRSSATAYFNRTAGTATNQSIATWSFWFKRGTLGTTQRLFEGWTANSDSGNAQFEITTSDVFAIGGYTTNWLITTQVFRDPSAWYHIVVAFDTTQATASNRIKLYVNGSQVTVFGTASYPTQNTTFGLNNNSSALQIGRRRINSVSDSFYDGYLTEINMVDGQQLTPSSFGQTNSVTGVWQPIKYGGTYGTNGFYLNFSDNSNNTATTIGKDYSGNGNNWTPNNISVTSGATYDSMIDVPTPYADGNNGRGNYAVLNPLDKSSVGTLDYANLRWLCANSGVGVNGNGARASIGMSSGLWYCEITIGSTTAFWPYPGVSNASHSTGTYNGGDANSWSVSSIGQKVNNNSSSSYGSATWTTGDRINIALNMDTGKIWFGKNGTYLNSGSPAGGTNEAFSSLTGPLFFTIGFSANNSSASDCLFNCGQQPFVDTPPTGYVALNTQNLPTPTISNGANYMAATTYTGTGATQTIANSGNNAGAISFKPDLVWIKSRSVATNNNLFDSVRGTTNYLISNSTAAEATNANTLTAFGTTGFTLGSDAGAIGVNVNAATYVGWQWKAGGTASSNTNGSITSTVSVGATQGFSVVTYTGNGTGGTVGHGLGVAPSMIIVKTRNASNDWAVYHASIGATKFLFLDSTATAGTSITVWNNTAPTSSVFTVATDFSVNQITTNYVAYCFAEVAGYSKIGIVTGNASADGVFGYCGFRPRWILFKEVANINNWYIYDTSRDTYNVDINPLWSNSSAAEAANSNYAIDILSNGFKFRTSVAGNNTGGTIFMAFAEVPFKYSLAR